MTSVIRGGGVRRIWPTLLGTAVVPVAASDISLGGSELLNSPEYLLIGVSIMFFITLPIYLFWYSLGCLVLMRLDGWSVVRGAHLSGKPLRKRVVQVAILITVVVAFMDILVRGITTARNEGLDALSLLSLAVIFISVLGLSALLMGQGTKGASLLAGGMTLMSAATWLLIFAMFGGMDGSNPMPAIIGYTIVCAALSVITLRTVAKAVPNRAASQHHGTKTG